METPSACRKPGRGCWLCMKPLGTEMSHSRGRHTAAAKEDSEFQALSQKMYKEKTSVKMVKGWLRISHILSIISGLFLWKKIALFERNQKLRLSILPSVEKHKPSLGGLKSNSQAFIWQAKSMILSIAFREKWWITWHGFSGWAWHWVNSQRSLKPIKQQILLKAALWGHAVRTYTNKIILKITMNIPCKIMCLERGLQEQLGL